MAQQPIDIKPITEAIQSSNESVVQSQLNLIAKLNYEQMHSFLELALRQVLDGPRKKQSVIEEKEKYLRDYHYASSRDYYKQEIEKLNEQKTKIEASSKNILSLIERVIDRVPNSYGHRGIKHTYEKLFLELVKSGRCDYVKFILDRVCLQLGLFDNFIELINCKGNSFSALHIAVINKHCDMVKLLLALGADVTKKDERKRTPLHYAVDTISCMQQNKAFQIYGSSELFCKDFILAGGHAVQNQIDVEIIKALLEFGATCLALNETQSSTSGHNNEISVFVVLAKQSYYDNRTHSENQHNESLIQAFELLAEKFPLTDSIKEKIRQVNNGDNWLLKHINAARFFVSGTAQYDSFVDKHAVTVNKLSDEIQRLKRTLHSSNTSSEQQARIMAADMERHEESNKKLMNHMQALEQRIQQQEKISNEKILELTKKLDELQEPQSSSLDPNSKDLGGENKRRRASSPTKDTVSTASASEPVRSSFTMFQL